MSGGAGTRALERRAKEIRARALVRRWEYRQRHHAKGVWFRLRSLLAQAKEAYAISADAAARLEAKGCAAEAVGAELHPPRNLRFIDGRRLADIADRRPLPLQLDAILAEEHVALVGWDDP